MKKRFKKTPKRDAGIGARIVLVLVLAVTLIGVLRWSLNVTRANAKQISHNLVQIQQQMNSGLARNRDRDLPGAKVKGAPSIDPEGAGGR